MMSDIMYFLDLYLVLKVLPFLIGFEFTFKILSKLMRLLRKDYILSKVLLFIVFLAKLGISILVGYFIAITSFYSLIFPSAAFLIGVRFTYAILSFVLKRILRKRITSKPLELRMILGIFLLLALGSQVGWSIFEYKKYRSQVEKYLESKQQQFKIMELRYDPTQDKPFTLVFLVPKTGIYGLLIIGFSMRDSSIRPREKRVVKTDDRSLYTEGINQFSFDFIESIQSDAILDVDFSISIDPPSPQEKFFYRFHILGVIEEPFMRVQTISDGICYYSPKLEYFDIANCVIIGLLSLNLNP